MKFVRSFLFVPGNKTGWIEKSVSSQADALILDLEDSVPPAQKPEAREIVRSKLAWLAEQKQRTWVRINRSPHLYDFDDILAVVGSHLEGIALSKPNGVEDIDTVSAMLAEAEYRKGVRVGSTLLLPILETARSMQLAFDIAQRPRVTAITGLSVKNGDVARALGTGWTAEGRESLFLKSRVVMAARAAGKQPIGGLWQQVHDLEGLAKAAAEDRCLGMSGQLLLHPSNVAIVNRIYSPSPEEVAYCRGLIDAVERAQAAGRASTIYEGEHVDIAHANTARAILALARSFEN
ncbi:CoA ester lyase [Variovorax sp. WS11]|uniref:HpcH/HpaI aldolase/citrate lyase family protein n=1 Tax=Variovorax sp. WS11 TaxID=1105204 RepID=UPI000D0DC6F0|nr:CoA ester lyase [Variovorax sp. WS11]NDZ18782.1 CoA ester lyase [Variovorax sp. WS11]PSL82558.1 CoA ester lyase [Variovorax sp. WS11]